MAQPGHHTVRHGWTQMSWSPQVRVMQADEENPLLISTVCFCILRSKGSGGQLWACYKEGQQLQTCAHLCCSWGL